MDVFPPFSTDMRARLDSPPYQVSDVGDAYLGGPE